MKVKQTNFNLANYKVYKQNTVSATSFPTTFYAKGDNLPDWTLSGNCYQASTPTVSNPVDIEECGDLVTSGEHAGQYIIPISIAGTTTNLYLSEPFRKIGDYADTVDESGAVTRRVKKAVLDGTETYSTSSAENVYLYKTSLGQAVYSAVTSTACSHYLGVVNKRANDMQVGEICVPITLSGDYIAFKTTFSFRNDFINFVAQQYANGTPVTVYYVLATPTTESITPVSIQTAAGTNTLDFGTSLAPSKFEADLGNMFMPALEKVRVNGAWT